MYIDPSNRFTNFFHLREKNKWPIDPRHAIEASTKIQLIFGSHFMIQNTDISNDPELISRLGYASKESAQNNLENYTFLSTDNKKCWVIFNNVTIGSGVQSTVKIALEIFSGEVDAVNIQALSDNKKVEQFNRQIEIFNRLTGKPFILQLKGNAFIRHTDGKLFGCLLSEYCARGDLLDYVNKIGAGDHMILSLIQGVRDIHEANIIHRDLKLENIFLNANHQIRIGDMGFACIDGTSKQCLGTPAFSAFELVNNQSNSVTKKLDIWSLGVIIYSIIYRQLPPHSNLLAGIAANQITMARYQKSFEIYNDFYEDLCDSERPLDMFIRQFFVPEPDFRPSIREIQLPDYFLDIASKHLSDPYYLKGQLDPSKLVRLVQKILQKLPLGVLYDVTSLTQKAEDLSMSHQEITEAGRNVKIFPQSICKVWIIFEKIVLSNPRPNSTIFLTQELFSTEMGNYTETISPKGQKEDKQAFWECRSLKMLKGHPGVLQYIANVNSRSPLEDKITGLFTMHPTGDTLHDVINKGQSISKQWINEILEVVKYIHQHGIIHRNLRLDRIFLEKEGSNQKIVVSDFSASCLSLENPQELVGSPTYYSPELLNNPPLVSEAQDVWALGVIFYALLKNEFPGFTKLLQKGYDKTQVPEVLEQMRIFCESPALDLTSKFVKQFFVMDPAKRPNTDQIKHLPSSSNHVRKKSI